MVDRKCQSWDVARKVTMQFSYLKELGETGLVKRNGTTPPQELQERLS